MKLVLYDKKTLKVMSIYQGVINPILEGNTLSFSGGKVGGMREHIAFAFFEPTFEVSEGDTLKSDQLSLQLDVDLRSEIQKLRDENQSLKNRLQNTEMSVLSVMDMMVSKGGA